MSTEKILNKKVVLTTAQFESRKAAGTLQEGVEYELSDAKDAVEGVTINGTSIVDATTHVANIPIGNNTLGAVKVASGTGININANGIIYSQQASAVELTSKTNEVNSVVPANLDTAIREGLGNNSLTWSDAYKTSARNTIGAYTAIEYTGSESSYEDGVFYYTVE